LLTKKHFCSSSLYLGGLGLKIVTTFCFLKNAPPHTTDETKTNLAKRLKGQLKYEDIVVHFGACSFMQADKKVFQKFKDLTGARIVSGYTEEIPFISSMLLDMAYFNFLQEKGAFDSVYSKFIKGVHAELIKELGFVVY